MTCCHNWWFRIMLNFSKTCFPLGCLGSLVVIYYNFSNLAQCSGKNKLASILLLILAIALWSSHLIDKDFPKSPTWEERKSYKHKTSREFLSLCFDFSDFAWTASFKHRTEISVFSFSFKLWNDSSYFSIFLNLEVDSCPVFYFNSLDTLTGSIDLLLSGYLVVS